MLNLVYCARGWIVVNSLNAPPLQAVLRCQHENPEATFEALSSMALAQLTPPKQKAGCVVSWFHCMVFWLYYSVDANLTLNLWVDFCIMFIRDSQQHPICGQKFRQRQRHKESPIWPLSVSSSANSADKNRPWECLLPWKKCKVRRSGRRSKKEDHYREIMDTKQRSTGNVSRTYCHQNTTGHVERKLFISCKAGDVFTISILL